MEDEVIQTTVSSEPTSDVVETTVTEQPSNQVTPPVEGALPENPVTPEQPGMTVAPKTEREKAIEYIESERSKGYSNKDNGLSNWIRNNYNYDPSVAGTMWVAGQINDVNTQMSFLEAIINESMYDEMDLQKYYFDQNLATAKAYAQQKKFETAYGYYRAAQEKALAEGELTGWYLPAEANYMLGQWTIADEVLKDPNSTADERARAQSVSSSTARWFEANNITERGIKCLNMLYYEETVRHNKEMERLQWDANDIQRKNAEASSKAAKDSYDIQLREWQFNNAQMELQYGADLNKDGVIGFDNNNFVTEGFEFRDFESIFGQYDSTYDWAMANPTQAFMVTNRAYMKEVLGDDYQTAYNTYKQSVQDTSWLKAQYETGNGYIEGTNIDALTNTKLKKSEVEKVTDYPDNVKDSTIRIIRTNNNGAQLWIFNKDGVGYQITDGSLQLTDGRTVDQVLQEQGLTLDTKSNPYLTYTDDSGKQTQLYIGRQNYSSYSHLPNSSDPERYDGMNSKSVEAIEYAVNHQGYKYEYGLRDLDNENSFIVLSKEEDGKKVYYAMDPYTGKMGKIKDQDDVVNVHINSDGTYEVTKADGGKLSDWQNLPKNKQEDYFDALRQSEKIGTIKKEGKNYNIYAYTNQDGSVVYWYGDMELSENKYGITAGGSTQVGGFMSKDEVSQHVSDVDKIATSKENYMNDVMIDNSQFTSTKNVEETIDEDEKTNQKTKSDAVGTIKTNYSGSSSSSSSGSATKTSKEKTSKGDSKKASASLTKVDYKDTDFDLLLGENGNTLFTQEQIEEQNKRLKESNAFLESI